MNQLRKFFLPVLMLFLSPSCATSQTPEDFFKKLKTSVNRKSVQAFSFVQRTVIYNKDATTREETWYEAVQYPDKLRIDFLDPKKQNTSLHRNDSTYSFREGQLVNSRFRPNEFLTIEGGILSLTAEQLKDKLAKAGYDVSIVSQTSWNSRPVYILGALPNDSQRKQCWFDAEHLYMVRRLMPRNDTTVLDVQYEDFKKYKGSWIESRVKFLENNKLIQDEFYLDITPVRKFDERLFDPHRLFECHWYDPTKTR